MSNSQLKESSSYETCESLSNMPKIFAIPHLAKSESEFGESNPQGEMEAQPTTDIAVDPFQRVMEWFEARGIKTGHPENIVHSFTCHQRDECIKPELCKSLSLSTSMILLRRGKSSSREDRKGS
jgi:hypothetical protein